MSYEICAFDAAFASGKEAAFEAWDQGTYFDASLPDYDRSARKWRIKESLMAFNPELTCDEPKDPTQGFLAKVFSKPPSKHTYLTANLDMGDETASFDIFDHAVEIILPAEPETEQVQQIVRDMWRHLDKLSQLGFSTIYDAERDVLLNLATDFDVVVRGYIKNLDSDDDAEDAPAERALPQIKNVNVSPPRENKPPPSAAPFAGNVDESKPWWKLW